MTIITPQRQLIGTSSQDMRVETDRMLTRLAIVSNQQSLEGTPVDAMVPVPIPDGVIKVFSLPVTVIPSSLQLFLAGILQTQGATSDYTLKGRTITFGTAPALGLFLIAWGRAQ